jgi:integrase/recombinase XerD
VSENTKKRALVPKISNQSTVREKENNSLLKENLRHRLKPHYRRNTIDKDTPLKIVQEMFICDKQGEGLTANTITYYNNVWNKLFDFVGHSAIGEKSAEIRQAVSEQSLDVILTDDNIQVNFRRYMKEVCGNAEQTILSNMRGLRAIMKFIADKTGESTIDIKVRDIEPPIKVLYTDKEIEILSRKPDPRNFIDYRAWILGRYTMATSNRVSSAANVRIRDIDFDDGFVSVNVVKNRRPIRIPLTRTILKELCEFISYYRTGDDGEPLYDEPLFTTQYGEEMTPHALGVSYRKFCRKRGINKGGLHLLRHNYAKSYITSGGDVLSLKAMLGHRSLKMVNHYARIYGTDIKDSVEKHSLISQTKVTHGRKKIRAHVK